MSFRSKKWYHDIHTAMKQSQKLFVPELGMKWRFHGTYVTLRRHDQVVWHSHRDSCGSVYSYDYMGLHHFADMIFDYLSTPVSDLRSGIVINGDRKDGLWGTPRQKPGFRTRLNNALFAADRRIGKNILSVRLFIEPDAVIRNIIGARL